MARQYTKDVLERYKAIIISEIKRQLRAKPKPTTVSNGSILEGSISSKRFANANVDGLSISMNDYGFNVNVGRNAGKFPNVGTLKEWIERNGIKPKKGKDGKLQTINQLTYLIGRSVKNKGIRPYRFIDIAINKIEPRLTLDLVNAYLRDLNEYLDNNIPNPK